jgi:hypothetical protein
MQTNHEIGNMGEELVCDLVGGRRIHGKPHDIISGNGTLLQVKCSAPKLGYSRQFHWNALRGVYHWIVLVGVPEYPDPDEMWPIYFVLGPETLLTLIGEKNDLFCNLWPEGSGWKTKALFEHCLWDEQMIRGLFGHGKGPWLPT